uniref:Ovule protein n=1 Tax=Panagrellus redivivus TaxID=6233 RepID=A0A7E4V3Z2_PANRE
MSPSNAAHKKGPQNADDIFPQGHQIWLFTNGEPIEKSSSAILKEKENIDKTCLQHSSLTYVCQHSLLPTDANHRLPTSKSSSWTASI